MTYGSRPCNTFVRTAPPRSIEEDVLLDHERGGSHDPRGLLVPVKIAGRVSRVNVSVNEGLLARMLIAAEAGS